MKVDMKDIIIVLVIVVVFSKYPRPKIWDIIINNPRVSAKAMTARGPGKA